MVVNKEEIFILEGPRSIVRISTQPDVFETQSSSYFTSQVAESVIESTSVYNGATREDQYLNDDSDGDEEEEKDSERNASECKELPPIGEAPPLEEVERTLMGELWPGDEMKGEAQEEGPREELNKKLETFNKINDETFDDNILFRSRRLKVVEAISPSDEGPSKGIVEIAQVARADTEEDEEKAGLDEETKSEQETEDSRTQQEDAISESVTDEPVPEDDPK